MKVSLDLAQYFSNVDLKSIPRDELLVRMGAQLGAIEDVVDYAPKYKDVIVVKVVECIKHPDADKLSLCRVDDGGLMQHVEHGDDGLVQVVCGAPNVRAGIFAAWIPPGATVPSSVDTDPFILEARELRGKVSNGMLASPSELAISEDHDGILEIDEQELNRMPVVGEPITNFYGLDDYVIDCENKMFTHRPDCFGNLGVAREIAGIYGLKFKSPEWYWTIPQFDTANDISIDIKNEVPELVPRFMSVVMKDITVGPSPIWLQALLKRVGIKPINNVVDASNYVMHLTGQPTHAFDYDKLVERSNSPTLFPRKSIAGEKLVLLSDKEIELTGEELVISTDKQAVALAGVMGGAETEVDAQTKTIVLECATFNMYNIRRTSMRFGLFTDAVTRYNKGQSPLQNDRVLWFLMEKINEFAGGAQASPVYDLQHDIESAYDAQSVHGEMSVTADFVNKRLGTDLSNEDICQFLQLVECAAYVEDDVIKVTAPFWRTDIAIAEDIVEEIGRLLGYHNVPVSLPARTSKPAARNSALDFAQQLRVTLKQAGANEILTYSFVHGDLLRKTGTDPEKWAYHIRNAISPDLQYYRTSLLPSVLAKVRANMKSQAGADDNKFALYELGSAHVKGEFEVDEPTLPKQMRRLAFVFAADAKAQKWYNGSAYYQAKCYIDLLTNNQARYLSLDTNEYPITAPYALGRSAVVMVGDQMLGVVGEIAHRTRAALKLPEFCAGFELDMELLQAHLTPLKYEPLSTQPSTVQDMTLQVEDTVSWAQVEQLLHAELAVAKAELGYEYQLQPLDIFKPEDQAVVRHTYRMVLTHPSKTLKTDEVNLLLEQLSKAAHENLQAIRI